MNRESEIELAVRTLEETSAELDSPDLQEQEMGEEQDLVEEAEDEKSEEQAVLLQLMQEVDAVLRGAGIPYYLSPRLAISGFFGDPMPKNPRFGLLYVKARDLEKVRLALASHAGEGRAVDSMVDNPYFPGFYLRYVNTETLCYCLNKGRRFRYPGIAVDICPLRTKNLGGRRIKVMRKLEQGWKQTLDNYEETYSLKERIWNVPVRLLSVFGRKRLGALLFRQLCKCYRYKPGKQVGVERGEWNYFPSALFEKTGDVKLEGTAFMVPADLEQYLHVFYGKNLESKRRTKYHSSPIWIVNARVSCEAFLSQVGSLKKITKDRRSLFVKKDPFRGERRKTIDDAWKYLKTLEAGLNLAEPYKERRDTLRRLLEEKEYLWMERIFDRYTDMMDRFLRFGKVYYIDEELHQMYLEMLRHTGRGRYCNKIEKMIAADQSVTRGLMRS